MLKYSIKDSLHCRLLFRPQGNNLRNFDLNLEHGEAQTTEKVTLWNGVIPPLAGRLKGLWTSCRRPVGARMYMFTKVIHGRGWNWEMFTVLQQK